MIVIGYHGTDIVGAKGILDTKIIKPSSGKGHWLGTGTYFFQDAPERAAAWARHQFRIPRDQVRVFRCEIDLSSSLDLFDRVAFDELKQAYSRFTDWECAKGIVETQPRLWVYKGRVKISPSGPGHLGVLRLGPTKRKIRRRPHREICRHLSF